MCNMKLERSLAVANALIPLQIQRLFAFQKIALNFALLLLSEPVTTRQSHRVMFKLGAKNLFLLCLLKEHSILDHLATSDLQIITSTGRS